MTAGAATSPCWGDECEAGWAISYFKALLRTSSVLCVGLAVHFLNSVASSARVEGHRVGLPVFSQL